MTQEIRFSFTTKGQKIAHRYSRRSFREFRMSLDEAELMVASGQVATVVNGPSIWKPNVQVINRTEQNGTTFLTTIQN